MSDYKINTEQVKAVADVISRINREIREDFNELEDSIVKLDNQWDSPSSGLCISKFYDIKIKYEQGRFDEIENYASFLRGGVVHNSETTEHGNKSLSDVFE